MKTNLDRYSMEMEELGARTVRVHFVRPPNDEYPPMWTVLLSRNAWDSTSGIGGADGFGNVSARHQDVGEAMRLAAEKFKAVATNA